MSAVMRTPLKEDEITGLWALFGPPPVLSTENQQAYDQIRAGYVAYYKPTNSLQMKLVREVVDTEWEMSRFSRHRTVVIERRFRTQLENYASQLRSNNAGRKQEAERLSEYPSAVEKLARLQAVISRTESDIEEILKREPAETDHNRGLEQAAAFLNHPSCTRSALVSSSWRCHTPAARRLRPI